MVKRTNWTAHRFKKKWNKKGHNSRSTRAFVSTKAVGVPEADGASLNVLSLVDQFKSGFSLASESRSVTLKHLVGLVSGNPRSNHAEWWKSGEGAVRFKDARLSDADSGRMLQFLCLQEALAHSVTGYREMCDGVPDCVAWLLSGVHLRLEKSLGDSRDPEAVMTFLQSAEGRRRID